MIHIKNLCIKFKSLFSRSNCENVPGRNNCVQKTSGFGIKSTFSSTINNYNGEKSDISLIRRFIIFF